MVAGLLLFTTLALLIVLGTAWILDRLTPLTLWQAALLGSATTVVFTITVQREMGLPWLITVTIGPFLVPMAAFSFAGLAWLITLVSPLTFAQAALLATGLGLVVFYGYLTRLLDFPPEFLALEGEEGLNFGEDDEQENGLAPFTIISDYSQPTLPRHWVTRVDDKDDPREPPRRRGRRRKKR